jgi:hypothetical protein
VIPCSEQHLRRLLHEWIAHDNRGRPHASLGPGIPESVSAPILSRLIVIAWRSGIGSWRGRSSAGSITSTDSNGWREAMRATEHNICEARWRAGANVIEAAFWGLNWPGSPRCSDGTG